MPTPRLCLAAVFSLLAIGVPIRAGQEGSPAPEDRTRVDLDRDGLDDGFEQELLMKFLPSFFVSRNDCDSMPAEFRPFAAEPESIARNGVIYGQVFGRRAGQPQDSIEIHYYHLWSRDCGRLGHTLDAEHVSTLVRAESADAPVRDWRALYWYSGAHEDTICDDSSGAGAVELQAEDRGPNVWISSGKHASYLSHRQCSGGCGGDRCENMIPLAPPKVINIGELESPINGALWIQSERWPLASKFRTDFDDSVLARLGDGKTAGAVRIKPNLRPTQAVLAGGNSTANAVESSSRRAGTSVSLAGEHTEAAVDAGDRNTEAALATADENTRQALDGTRKAVLESMRKTSIRVRRLLGGR